MYTSRYYSYTLYPQYDANNEISGVGILASDVTSQALHNKKITESEERFRTLTETLPQLIWVTDALGQQEFASSRWQKYSGVDPYSVNAWEAVLHPEDFEFINSTWAKSLTTGIKYKSEMRLKSRTGEYRWHTVEAESVCDSDNEIIKWVGAFTDIHDQKLKEEKKDEFMGIASHEMKTPLKTTKAYLQILESSLDESNKEAKLFATKANEAVEKLNELISELLDVSKMQFGKLNYSMRKFNFNDLIKNTVENIQLTSPSSNISLTGKVNHEIVGDENRLQQVVINLLSNDIKYSPESQKICVTVIEENDNIQVAVKDYGIGIAEEHLVKIFDKYHRVEEHAVKFQGMGVGSFIPHEIIQRHGGKLWAESEVGKGSTFILPYR